MYDYVVVGGGTAGVAIAVRLSQGLPSASILLIEAGPIVWDELKINVPGMKGSALGGKYDWNFTTVAQLSAHNRVFPVNRGKVLGGCSALNLMTYNRAVVNEYDTWEDLGNTGWNWQNMMAAMKKSENFTGTNTATYGSPSGVGDSGPVHAVVNRFVPEQQDTWIPTMNSLGIAHNPSSLDGDSLGVMYQPSSVDPTHYNRSYSANAYMPLAGSNLYILSETTVAKIDFSADSGSQRATGVTLQNGTTIAVRREVILSAGAVQSPVLLELSGIGNATLLSAAGITTIIDLPSVGENLQDHLRVMTSYQLKSNYSSLDLFKYNATYAAEQLSLWNDGQYSRYDYTGSAFAMQTWNQTLGSDATLVSLAERAISDDAGVVQKKKLELLSDDLVPQIEIIFSDGYTGFKGYPSSDSPLFGKNFFSLLAVIMHPLSRGSIHIDPSAPSGKPIINPNYLSNDYDLEAVTQAAKYNRKIAQTAPMNELWDIEYEPGLSTVTTDADWKDYVLNTTLSIYHPSGTCSMLPKADGGVVDSNLTVYGTTNLRVADASIIPLLISGHLQTAVYGIAEIAAEKIISAA
ncbi:choline dehydrogenase [Grosmannia clavigera kw1407]|uniref:Choline dehydrogenase n=1 Tax=Grosmannia clavigera (strain kw1407 / UAMH 11150) TaxID=655863 RepID=F0XG53_GROCL|nr:choline dehydrogenase [Grosmannia clavigera kw1407]EFX03370.1 choline dehydrogenase [Grosmannia clavigera kw1407]